MPPTSEQHIRHADHNEQVSLTIETTGVPDWAMTAMFYAALHLADAVLMRSFPRPENHRERFEFVNRDGHLRHVKNDYMELYQRSREARHQCAAFIDTGFVQRIRQNEYSRVRERARRALGLPI